MSGNKSFMTILEMTTQNENLTPVIDLESMSVFVTKNRINNPASGTTPDFVAETNASQTSAEAKYLTKPIVLDNNSTGAEDVNVIDAEDDGTFSEYKFSASDLSGFTAFQLKIVLTGTNSAIAVSYTHLTLPTRSYV